MNRIVSLGGGVTSTGLLPLHVQKKYPNDNIVLLIAVIRNEHPDVWKMCQIISEKTGIPVTYITYDSSYEGNYRVISFDEIHTAMDIWELFDEQNMIASSVFDVCSSKMKREILKRYIQDNFSNKDTVVHLGITHDEAHRMKGVYRNWTQGLGYRVKADLIPLTAVESFDKQKVSLDIFGFVPELYQLGFSHNNCSGYCVKAGKKHLKKLLETLPEVYHYHEEQEAAWQAKRDQTFTALRETRNGKRYRLTLRELRDRIEKTGDVKYVADEQDDNSADFACTACEVF